MVPSPALTELSFSLRETITKEYPETLEFFQTWMILASPKCPNFWNYIERITHVARAGSPKTPAFVRRKPHVVHARALYFLQSNEGLEIGCTSPTVFSYRDFLADPLPCIASASSTSWQSASGTTLRSTHTPFRGL